jgi:hypothetical protein
MVVLMAAFGQTAKEDLDPKSLEYVWRGQYAIAATVLACLTAYRLVKLQETKAWKAAPTLKVVQDSECDGGIQSAVVVIDDSTSTQPSLDGVTSYGSTPDQPLVTGGHESRTHNIAISTFLSTQWSRLVGTSVGWLVWDVTFYGVCFAVHQIVGFGCSQQRFCEQETSCSKAVLSQPFTAIPLCLWCCSGRC